MRNNNGLLVFALCVLLFVTAVSFVAYRISVSDLPDWFKFFLLRG